jgi:cysteine desulfurase/selenocysteine lyase
MSKEKSLIYLDNAATSFPKPPEVARAMQEFLTERAVNPGRSGFDLSLAAGQMVDRVRGKLDRFFNNPARDPARTVFCANATAALNLAIQGICRPGDHVVSTVLEHNSVLRPLNELCVRGVIKFDLAPCDEAGRISPSAVVRLLRPETRLVVMTHASNVSGRLQPVAEVGRLCRERGVLMLLDAAQTAGVIPLDMDALSVDMVAFTGHKGLQGPTGIGGLVVGPKVDIASTIWGGTGVRSAEALHPEEYPYRLEAGTLNTVGIAGLEAGLDWIRARGIDELHQHERELTRSFLSAAAAIPGLRIIGHSLQDRNLPTVLPATQLGVVSVVLEDRDPEKVAMFLDADHEIAVRAGLQCAPLAHEALGTAPGGTIRFSFGPFNTLSQVKGAAKALATIAEAS